jgi:hypothetical protein
MMILCLSYSITTVLSKFQDVDDCAKMIQYKKLTLNSGLKTYQILTNKNQMIILCLSYLITTVFQDIDDCAKMFICQLSTKPEDNLDGIEQNISSIFGTNEQGALDATKPSVLFDLAAIVGRNAGFEQCKTLYARCQMPYDEMLQFMSQKEKPTTILNNDL